MKQKTLIQLFLFFSLFFSNKLFACLNVSYTTTQVGNTVTFAASVPVGYVINTYYWTFGDGNNSTSPNPTHTYANGGGYNACMVISGIDNNNNIFQCSYCDSLYIPNNVPCNASYTFTTTGNTANFNSTATGPGVITNYAWNFGDGNQSNLQNPSHTYANSGTYNVCHTIYGIDNGITYTCNWCDSVTVNVNNQPCNASFIYTISGNLVAFTNTATGPGAITNYAWNFGDGNQSNLANPTHTYATTGWYYVCLTIYGIDNGITYTCNWCDSIYVQVPGGNPCNGVNYTSTQVGNQVSFSPSLPVGYVVNTYYWTFGDGGTSNVANPTHTYANNGSYTACMVVSGTTPNNGFFQCTWCDSILIGMNVPCNASFISTTSGNTVTLTNTATGPGMITGYAWTFGDGGTSTAPNPTHTYANNGSYNVCLTITGIDNNITYTCTWCDSVTVGNNINPCNNISYMTTQIGNAVTFNALVPVGFVPTTYYWTFGDGGTSNVAIPTHTYLNNGWYNACLVISGIYNNTMITCTWCDSLYVGNNIQPCAATFTTSISGNTATFTNTATGPGMITGYAWTFGDGGTSTSPNPSHTYANNGWYNVCLTITGIDNGATYSCTWCDSINIQMGGNPCNGVYFTPSQTGNIFTFAAVTPPGYTINTYYWTFGDGGTSNVANPTHTYANNGWYNVCMVISGVANNTPFQCSICDSVYVIASGLQDVNNNNVLHVYPNPANNFIQIDIPSKEHYVLKLYDVAGKLLDERKIIEATDQYTYTTDRLSKGMYFIQLTGDTKKYQTNFIKQ